MKSLVRQY